ncbi:polynucleotide kinase 3 phosphatase-domain-containing protein [Scenedesmus sp. NREL 46B-D3]|nr:polynucleotide kinase 3 phosphatase-domain-containing protein [Scenedesmus sp. NREL 46B-D3]
MACEHLPHATYHCPDTAHHVTGVECVECVQMTSPPNPRMALLLSTLIPASFIRHYAAYVAPGGACRASSRAFALARNSSRTPGRMGKRKEQEEVDSDELDEDIEVKAKPKKPRAPRTKKVAEPSVDDLGYNIEPPSLIWKDFGTEPNAKIAAFDLDGTLVEVKSGAQFPKHAGDWRWFNKKVPEKLAEFSEQGYKLVLFTNQGSIKSALGGVAAKKVKDRIDDIQKKLKEEHRLELPWQVFIAPAMAPGDPMRKPAPGMWRFMAQHCNGGTQPDLKQCFFVGDADGTAGSHSSSDLEFAKAVGIAFKTPTEVFGPMEGKASLSSEQRKAAMEAAHSGAAPNSELVLQFEQLSKDTFEAVKRGEGDAFRASAYKKVAEALATFPSKITTANLKEVGKLKGVGKGSLDKVKKYLECGHIQGEEGAQAAAAEQQQHQEKFSKATEAAMQFM